MNLGHIVDRYRSCAVLILVWLAIGATPPQSFAQSSNNYILQAGNPTFSTNDPLPGGIGFVNLANGNLHLEIPLANYPQRGNGRAPYTAKLTYDSRQWLAASFLAPPQWITNGSVGNMAGGWGVQTSEDTGVAFNSYQGFDHAGYNVGNGSICSVNNSNVSYWIYTQFSWFDPTNTEHDFPMELVVDHGCGVANVLKASAYATDGSGLYMSATAVSGLGNGDPVFPPDTITMVVYTRDGRAITPLGNPSPGIKDSNGNYSTDRNILLGNPPTDTLNRQPFTITLAPNHDTGHPLTYPPPVAFNVLNSANQLQAINAKWDLIHVHTNFGASGFAEADFNEYVLEQLTLPDGSAYNFRYDCDSTTGIVACNSPGGQTAYYGLLTAAQLPTLGPIYFTHAKFSDANSNVNLWVKTKTYAGGTWTYTPQTGCGTGCQTLTVATPSNDHQVYKFDASNGTNAWVTSASYYSGAVTGTPLLNVQTNYSSFPLNSLYGTTGYVVPTSTLITLQGPAGNLVKSTAYSFDQSSYQVPTHPSNPTILTTYTARAGKLASQTEFGFGNGAPGPAVRKTSFSYWDDSHTSYKTQNLIQLVSDILVADSQNNPVAETKISYDTTAPVAIPGISAVAGHDDAVYGTSFTQRGNPTQVQQLVSTGNYLSTTLTYDTTGQVVKIVDPASNTTTFDYTDRYFTENGSTPPPNYSPTVATNAYLTTLTAPLVGSSLAGYFYGSGKPAVVQDFNSSNAWAHYLDVLDRATLIAGPYVNASRGWSLQSYTSPSTIDTYTGIADAGASAACSSCAHTTAVFDAFGRISKEILASDPEGATTRETGYDASGRVTVFSHPHRTQASNTDGLESLTYDGLDRIIQTTHPDGSSAYVTYGTGVSLAAQLCSASASGLAYPVMTTDEAQKKVEYWVDGLGRLLEVDEPPTTGSSPVATCYTYDLNDNPLQVSQAGVQTRSFIFDALSRATSISNPETGQTQLFYTTSTGSLCAGDPADVCRITDGRGITTTLTYDALNRLTKKTYSDGVTPNVFYYYDLSGTYYGLQVNNGIGKLTAISDSNANAIVWSYDPSGNITGESRTINGHTKISSYTYNLDGSISSFTFPSGRKLSYSYSNAQRPISIIDSANQTNYLTGATYVPTGALSSAVFGKTSGSFLGITESRSYNSRLELTSINASSSGGALLGLNFAYSLPTGNNGILASVTDTLHSGESQSFQYDSLNRLLSGNTTATSGPGCWGQSFGLDTVGNLDSINPTQCPGSSLSVIVNSKNQITSSGYGYDLGGNMTQDASGNSFSFDAEGRITQSSGMAGGPYSYLYDGSGLRIAKTFGATSGTYYWRDPTGETSTESDTNANPTSEYIYFDGRRIARRDSSGTVYYNFIDQLNSTRVVALASNGQACFRSDYTPYGQELSILNSCPQTYKFTGFERDSETNLDYAFARFYSSRLGRFLSADPSPGDFGDAQSWNAYTYVENNAINEIDPTGMDGCDALSFSCVLSTGGESGDGTGFGAFGGGLFAGVNGVGGYGSNPVLSGQIFWTPQGYNPCALGGCGGPSMRASFNPPTSSIGPPSFVGSLIPVYGSARTAINDFQTGHWVWGLVNTGLAVSDVFLVKSLFVGLGKVAIKGVAVGVARASTRAVSEEAVSQVVRNRAVGNAFRDEVANMLRMEGRGVQTEVGKWTPMGRRVIDIEISHEGRVLGGIETKWGTSRYTSLQRLKDAWLTYAHKYPVVLVRGPLL